MARNKYPEETIKLIIDEALKLFIEKGYENTSIQDILNNLGGLSKGAIYHHFKSKEEIFVAVCEKIGQETTIFYNNIRDDKFLTGYEKLKLIIKSADSNPSNEAMRSMNAKISTEPKFFMSQIMQIFDLVVPLYLQPIIEEGIKDGSIKTEYPKELAEVIIVLMNIWINPAIATTTPDEMIKKLHFFKSLLLGIGIDLLDEETINQFADYTKHYPSCK